MSLTSTLFTGVSGLLNQAEGMNVIANNISNVNTIGFKGARTLFSDVLSSTVAGGSQLGRGVQIQKIDNQFTQASFESTGNAADVAIQGDRFFVLAKPGTTAATVITGANAYYTRAGSFRLDGQATTAAPYVAGSLVNPDGYAVLDSAGLPIRIPLTSDGLVPAAASYMFQKISSIDAKGVITLLYADATGASKTCYYAGAAGAAANPPLDATAANYTTVTTAGNAMNGQLGTVKIGNPGDMEKVGGTLFKANAKSGIPAAPSATENWASNGITEKISGNNIEQSNVDMAAEFIKMILTQRAYSANSKSITTADDMTQEVLNLKR